MHANMDETLHMKFEGPIAQDLLELNPVKYKDFLFEENGKKIVYVQLKKALYGTLQAALLFWQDLSSKLLDWEFELNQYNNCVANKIIDGKQCTVLWHVDDLKISHVNEGVVDSILEKLNQAYGKETPLVINKGQTHDYLGMVLDFSTEGKCKINMKNYIEEILEEHLPADSGIVNTPAATHLFNINEIATKLNANEAEKFRQITAKLLFLSERGRPDIQTAVAFLTTRVKGPDEDDKKKLARVLVYLNCTKI
jgi:Reverse transcriptase (RNA-dependent DNA polymerase)